MRYPYWKLIRFHKPLLQNKELFNQRLHTNFNLRNVDICHVPIICNSSIQYAERITPWISTSTKISRLHLTILPWFYSLPCIIICSFYGNFTLAYFFLWNVTSLISSSCGNRKFLLILNNSFHIDSHTIGSILFGDNLSILPFISLSFAVYSQIILSHWCSNQLLTTP